MLYDNALMLKAYLMALQFGHNEAYANVACETADWVTGTMKSPEGAFYAHQDADVEAHDDGTYWTWTRKEIEIALTKDETEVVELYFDIRDMPNDTHGFPERNVLRIAVNEAQIAKQTGRQVSEITILLNNAKKKLNESRNRRHPPCVDKTILADRNGLVISALVEASLALKVRKYFEDAESAADFILRKMIDPGGKVAHAFSGKVLYQGLLDDNVYFGTALLDLFDVTRNDVQINAAEKIAQVLLDEFEDREAGGFFDRQSTASDEGLLVTKRKPIDDNPTPSGNSGAAIFFDRLFGITENKKYFDTADRTLKAFAGSADRNGIYAANYARAVGMHLRFAKNVR